MHLAGRRAPRLPAQFTFEYRLETDRCGNFEAGKIAAIDEYLARVHDALQQVVAYGSIGTDDNQVSLFRVLHELGIGQRASVIARLAADDLLSELGQTLDQGRRQIVVNGGVDEDDPH